MHPGYLSCTLLTIIILTNLVEYVVLYGAYYGSEQDYGSRSG